MVFSPETETRKFAATTGICSYYEQARALFRTFHQFFGFFQAGPATTSSIPDLGAIVKFRRCTGSTAGASCGNSNRQRPNQLIRATATKLIASKGRGN